MWPVIELLLDEDLPLETLLELQDFMSSTGIKIQRVPASRLLELCRAEDHQGFLARMGELPCRSLEDLERSLQSRGADSENSKPLPPLFIVCDRLQDAHNFGAILRCCDAMKVDGVIIGEKSQVSVTPHVARASAGAVNHLTLYRVPSLADAVVTMKRNGLRILAATEKTDTLLWQADSKGSLAVVIGSEAVGIAPDLLSECDLQIAIPMLGGVSSLNAAVAAGIVLYECRRQQMS